jgi:hypothetical protein
MEATMARTALLALFAFVAMHSQLGAQDKNEALLKALDLGSLGDDFKLVAAAKVFDQQTGGQITLKLQALKDIDTSALFYKAGFFDKDNHLHLSSPARLEAAFPLKKGESINMVMWEGRTPQEWHRISIRKVDKVVPRSEYHN